MGTMKSRDEIEQEFKSAQKLTDLYRRDKENEVMLALLLDIREILLSLTSGQGVGKWGPKL